jgi:hypothetical protein
MVDKTKYWGERKISNALDKQRIIDNANKVDELQYQEWVKADKPDKYTQLRAEIAQEIREMADLSEQKIKYKDNCTSFSWKTYSDSDDGYFGQGDYHKMPECSLDKMVKSDEYTSDYAKFYCPVYCPFYKNKEE